MTEPINAMDVGQADYMKLFLQELTYQDPLKPIDNREFMAQMAQFSALQQAVTTNQQLTALINNTAENRGINLLGRSVKIAGSESYAEVKAVLFKNNQAPEIRVLHEKGGTSTVDLNQIVEVL